MLSEKTFLLEQKAFLLPNRFKYLIFYLFNMIETDYVNGALLIKRGDKTVKTFTFKDFVSAKQFKPVNVLRNELVKISQGKKDVTQAQVDKLEKEFYDKCTSISLTNPIPHAEAMEIMTTAELEKLSEEILIFLVNWSSIEAVKQYASQLVETEKNNPQP